jgi:hypothetical protein
MSDSKILRATAHRAAAERPATPSLWSDYQRRTWAERAPLATAVPVKVPAPVASGGGISRHAAITGSLHSYANYKSWAERVRTNWEPDKDKNR